MLPFKTKKKVGKCIVEVEEDESDAADDAGLDEELEVEEEEDEGRILNDEMRDKEDEALLDKLELSLENMCRIGNVLDYDYHIA